MKLNKNLKSLNYSILRKIKKGTGQTDRQTDRQTDIQTERQTDIVVHREVTLPKMLHVSSELGGRGVVKYISGPTANRILFVFAASLC